MHTPYPRSSPAAVWGTATTPGAAAAAGSGTERYQQLDSFRGVAVLASIVFNVYQFCNVDNALYDRGLAFRTVSSLDAAVPFLFVITGFLIYAPIARQAIDGGPPPEARRFLVRRALRLIPLYYLAVIIVWFLRQQSLPGDWRDLIEHLTFTHVFDGKRIFYTNGPAWAVSVLAFYYGIVVLLIPWLARSRRQLAGRRRGIAVASAPPAVLAAVSLLWRAWSFADRDRPLTGSSTTWYGPVANLDNFAIGMGVAVIVIGLRPSRATPVRLRISLHLAGLAILTIAFLTRAGNPWCALYFATTCSLAFGCLTAAAVLKPATHQPGTRMRWQILTRLGLISYGAYVWHEPILLALDRHFGLVHQTPASFLHDTTVVASISIAAGWLSYLLIQRPSNQLLKIFGSPEQPKDSAAAQHVTRSPSPR